MPGTMTGVEVTVGEITAQAAAPVPGGEPAAASPEPAPPGRRQRKKQRTRDALIDAAMGLFAAKGYDHTAVHEITDGVDVSGRAFFPYSAGKEDVGLPSLQAGKWAL